MQKEKLQISSPYYSSRPDYDSPKYARFPGERPSGSCRGMNQNACQSHSKDLGCKWIDTKLDQHYCRSPRNSVSNLVPPGSSAKLIPSNPIKASKISKCEGLSQTMCTSQTSPKCLWIEDVNGRKYCRTATNMPRSSAFPRRYSEEEKHTWYQNDGKNRSNFQKGESGESKSRLQKQKHSDRNNSMTEIEQKYCRCLLEVAAGDIFKYGMLRKNPYGICSNSISVATARRQGTLGSNGIRQNSSSLARSVQRGDCTENLNLKNLPTDLLFVHAMMRIKSSKGQEYFSQIPSVAEFSSNPESYRKFLIQQIEKYRSSK